jgi:hypothetical protein
MQICPQALFADMPAGLQICPQALQTNNGGKKGLNTQLAIIACNISQFVLVYAPLGERKKRPIFQAVAC